MKETVCQTVCCFSLLTAMMLCDWEGNWLTFALIELTLLGICFVSGYIGGAFVNTKPWRRAKARQMRARRARRQG